MIAALKSLSVKIIFQIILTLLSSWCWQLFIAFFRSVWNLFYFFVWWMIFFWKLDVFDISASYLNSVFIVSVTLLRKGSKGGCLISARLRWRSKLPTGFPLTPMREGSSAGESWEFWLSSANTPLVGRSRNDLLSPPMWPLLVPPEGNSFFTLWW